MMATPLAAVLCTILLVLCLGGGVLSDTENHPQIVDSVRVQIVSKQDHDGKWVNEVKLEHGTEQAPWKVEVEQKTIDRGGRQSVELTATLTGPKTAHQPATESRIHAGGISGQNLGTYKIWESPKLPQNYLRGISSPVKGQYEDRPDTEHRIRPETFGFLNRYPYLPLSVAQSYPGGISALVDSPDTGSQGYPESVEGPARGSVVTQNYPEGPKSAPHTAGGELIHTGGILGQIRGPYLPGGVPQTISGIFGNLNRGPDNGEPATLPQIYPGDMAGPVRGHFYGTPGSEPHSYPGGILSPNHGPVGHQSYPGSTSGPKQGFVRQDYPGGGPILGPVEHQSYPGGGLIRGPVEHQSYPGGGLIRGPVEHQSYPGGGPIRGPVEHQSYPGGGPILGPVEHQSYLGGGPILGPVEHQSYPGGVPIRGPVEHQSYPGSGLIRGPVEHQSYLGGGPIRGPVEHQSYPGSGPIRGPFEYQSYPGGVPIRGPGGMVDRNRDIYIGSQREHGIRHQSKWKDSEYTLYTIQTDWVTANKTCADSGAHLAIINSEEEASFLMDMLNRYLYSFNGAFVGITDKAEEGNWVTIEGEPIASAGFSRWFRDDQPDNENGNENCGSIISVNGGLNDVPCTGYLLHTICEKGDDIKLINKPLLTDLLIGHASSNYNESDKSSLRSEENNDENYYQESEKQYLQELDKPVSDYQQFPGFSSAYRVLAEQMDWETANLTCVEDGAYLAVINSEEEAMMLAALSRKYFDHAPHAFVGITYVAEEGTWLTIFGETTAEAGFARWLTGEQPENVSSSGNDNDYCGAFSPLTGGLVAVPCKNVLEASICEKDEDTESDSSHD